MSRTPNILGWLAVLCGIGSIVASFAYGTLAMNAMLDRDHSSAIAADWFQVAALLIAIVTVILGVSAYAAGGARSRPWPLGCVALCLGAIGLLLAFIQV